MHVLLVEDDDRVAAALRSALHRHGMKLTRLDRGRGVTDHLSGVDVVLLDLGLPDVDGVDVCREVRTVSDVPVIVVSARGEVDDRILGLHSGADDYLVKPYDVGELVARVHAVYRRHRVPPGAASATPPDVVELANVTVDRQRHTVTVDGRSVTLSRKEFQVLAMLASSGGAVCTRNRIVAEVWGRSWAGANRTLDVHIASLRTKLGPRRPHPDRARRRLPARPAGQRCGVAVRVRVLVVILLLKAALAIGLGVPLALSDARASQLQMFTNRLTDTISFASLAGQPLAERNLAGLTAELQRYDSVFGVAVLVLDQDRNLVTASRRLTPVLDTSGWDRVDKALVNRRSEVYPLLMPWDERPMVLAEPVLVDNRVLGVVVTISPTDELRADVLQTWGTVGAIGLAALLLGALAALPVVRWILRPVRRLDEGTDRVAAAVLAGQAAEPISDGTPGHRSCAISPSPSTGWRRR